MAAGPGQRDALRAAPELRIQILLRPPAQDRHRLGRSLLPGDEIVIAVETVETLAGIEVVKSAAQEAQEKRKFARSAALVRDYYVKEGQVQARYLPILFFGFALTAAFALGLAAKPMLVTLPGVLLLLDFRLDIVLPGVRKPPDVARGLVAEDGDEDRKHDKDRQLQKYLSAVAEENAPATRQQCEKLLGESRQG